jgi:hypothetical protein
MVKLNQGILNCSSDQTAGKDKMVLFAVCEFTRHYYGEVSDNRLKFEVS